MSGAVAIAAATAIPAAVKWLTSAGLGAGSGIVSEIFKSRQDARDKAHELAILDRQIILADKQGAAARVDADIAGINAHADIETERLAYAGPKPSGIRLIDFLNGLLRPAAGFAAIGAFSVFSTVLLVSMGRDIFEGTLTYSAAAQAFEGSLTGDCIVSVWGFVFGARSFRAARSS